MLTDEFRRHLRDLYDEQDRMLFEHAQWEASREAGRLFGAPTEPMASPPMRKSEPTLLVYRTMENATPPTPQPDAAPSGGETDDDKLDEYSKGIAEFVVTWCNEKLAPRDARIAKLEAQVEVLLTLLGKSLPSKMAEVKSADVVELPKFLRRTTNAA